jgi:uncharacterized protein
MVSTNPTRRTALITGASGGIGLEFARLLAADGHNVVLVARNLGRLHSVADKLPRPNTIEIQCLTADLSQPRGAERLWSELQAAGVSIDILINNAGAGIYGPFDEHDPEQLSRMIQLNVVALTDLTRLALPAMRQHGWGQILNVASLASYQPGAPWIAAYYASKAYVLSLSKGLARELAGTGVSVTALVPGPTETSFDHAAGASDDLLYLRLPKSNASDVARAGYRGMKKGATVVIPGFLTKVLALAGELPPRRIALEVNRLLWMPRGTGRR